MITIVLLAIGLAALPPTPVYAGVSSAEPDPVRQSVLGDVCAVWKTSDGGSGSLRAAVDNPVCDQIIFAGSYTIPLTGTLNISRDLWIDGTGRTIVISGDTTGDGTGDVRPFNITGGVVVTFTQISIVKGYVVGEGGGVYLGSGSRLAVENCAFSGNSVASRSDNVTYGGAIANYGTLIVTGSTFSGNSVIGSSDYRRAGGAIANVGALTITNSSLSGNSSSELGGGLYNERDRMTTAISVTLSGNSAGLYGGGINNGGALIMENVTFTANSSSYNAGAISNDGTLTMTHSAFYSNTTAYNGGALWNGGTLALESSAFYSNTASDGNGGAIINNTGAATVIDSTFRGNQAQRSTSINGNGGAIASYTTLMIENSTFYSNTGNYQGGAISIESGTGTVKNSTISGNLITNDVGLGGGISSQGTLTIQNSTLYGNSAPGSGAEGGGIFLYAGTLHLLNTIIAGSTGGDCANPSWGGTIGTNTNNLIEDGTCGAAVTGDPKLGPLADNGGSTSTHLLLPGSPAMDAGDDGTCLLTDQRGVARPQNPVCDIGAVEAPEQPIIRLVKSVSPAMDVPLSGVVTYTLVLKNTGAFSDTHVLLTDTLPAEAAFKQWVEQPAGAVESGNEITWAGELANGDIVTSTFQVTYTGELGGSVVNTSVYSGTVAAGSSSATFRTMCSPVYTVRNSLDSGAGSLRQGIEGVCSGGAIHFDGDYAIYLESVLGGNTGITKTLTIDGAGHAVTVSGDTGNDGSRNVQAFYIGAGGVVTLSHLSVVSATGDTGGAILNQGTLVVQNSTFSDNQASQYGGALLNYGGTLTVQNSTFYSNTAALFGGGILNVMGSLTAQNSTFYGNSSAGGAGTGGGISNYAGTLNYRNTIIAGSTGGDCALIYGATIGVNANNLVKDGSCSAALTGDPRLASLADNGGGTLTFALLYGSPAIDAGHDASCPTTDQRGRARGDWQCDIGAFELQLNDSPLVQRLVTGGGSVTFGPTKIKMDFANIGELISVTVAYHAGPYTVTTGASGGAGVGWGPYYTFSGQGASGPVNSGFNLDLILPHDNLPDPQICWYAGTAWDCARSGYDASFVWRDGITGFSDWTVGNHVNPTAVNLRTLSALSHAGPGMGLLSALVLGALTLVAAAARRFKRLDRRDHNANASSLHKDVLP